MKKSIITLCLIIYALIVSAQDSSIIVFQHANVIDGISIRPLKNVMVTIANEKITAVPKGHFITVLHAFRCNVPYGLLSK